MSLLVQRAATRFVTHGDGWTGRYCFSYAEHYDPTNTGYGALLACNEFVLEPGAGFGMHRHAGIDIVTVVLEGVLQDVQEGESHVLREGEVRHLATEAGLEHDERNAGELPLRFAQVWLSPGTDPWLVAARDGQGATVPGPAFVFAATGEVRVDGELLEQGDSARSPQGVQVQAAAGATALCWTC
jgi:redox-sensitive bicupin YhaK (pirin superfamily)